MFTIQESCGRRLKAVLRLRWMPSAPFPSSANLVMLSQKVIRLVRMICSLSVYADHAQAPFSCASRELVPCFSQGPSEHDWSVAHVSSSRCFLEMREHWLFSSLTGNHPSISSPRWQNLALISAALSIHECSAAGLRITSPTQQPSEMSLLLLL